jgi:hypothetical protein
MHFLDSLWLRLKYAWQRLRRGYGDDEIDWELREKLEQENMAEMEALWGPGLIRLKAQAAQIKARAEIIGDERLSEEARLLKVRELSPDLTEHEFRERLSAMRIDRNATMVARDAQLDENEKISRIALLYPNMKRESIRDRIKEIKEEPNQIITDNDRATPGRV